MCVAKTEGASNAKVRRPKGERRVTEYKKIQLKIEVKKNRFFE